MGIISGDVTVYIERMQIDNKTILWGIIFQHLGQYKINEGRDHQISSAGGGGGGVITRNLVIYAFILYIYISKACKLIIKLYSGGSLFN